MFKFVLLSCLLVVALAHPHHEAGHVGGAHHDDPEKVEAPAVDDKAKPAEPKPLESEPVAIEAAKPADVPKEAEAEVAKPEADAVKKEHAVDAPVVPLEAHHADKPAKI